VPRLGPTNLEVSRIGVGLAAVGRPGYITLGRARDLGAERSPEALYERTAALLDAALAAGVRYVDAARSYGRAEEFLARWLAERDVAPEALTVGSKWGYRYTAQWAVEAPVHEQKELTTERFRAQLAETRALLGNRLALYQIHSATEESGCLADEGLLRALVEARRAGAFRALGVTLSGAGSGRTLDAAMDARIDGERVFDVVQATFNCLDPSSRDGLQRAHDAGLGVIVKEVHANGRLTAANDRPEDASLVARLGSVAAAEGLEIDQLALAFALRHEFVDVALSGAATTEQLESHLRAGAAPRLSAETLSALAAIREEPERYWATRDRLAWS